MAAKPNLKVVEDHIPERAALAAAIANAEAAAISVAEAEAANERSLEKLGAAFREQETLSRLRRDIERNAADTVAMAGYGRMISALAVGGDIEPPAAAVDRLGEVTQNLAAAEKEIEKWRAVRRAIEGEIADRQSVLELARREVDAAARAVAVASVDNVDAVIAQTLANLSTLFQLNLMAPGDARISSFFHGVTIMDQAAVQHHPAAQRLRDFAAALRRDADAAAAL
jgi:hypothetical protein